MKPYIPRGCGQQGRYPEAAEAPAPAEAATEIGADDAPGEHSAWYWLEEVVIGAALVAFVAFLVIVVGAV